VHHFRVPDFLICPDNTIQQALPQVVRRSPLPWPLADFEKLTSEMVAATRRWLRAPFAHDSLTFGRSTD
jgi:hypothetical protein